MYFNEISNVMQFYFSDVFPKPLDTVGMLDLQGLDIPQNTNIVSKHPTLV